LLTERLVSNAFYVTIQLVSNVLCYNKYC